MKRIGIITLFAALFCFMITSVAMAIPVNWQAGHTYQFKFTDYEWWDDANGDGKLTIGEELHGIFKVTSIYDVNTASTLWSYNIYSPDQLTGNFTYTITNLVATNSTTASGATIYKIYMTDNMDMYYNSVNNFNATWRGSWDPSLYNANAGAKWASFTVATLPFNSTIISSEWPIARTGPGSNNVAVASIQNASMYMTYDNTGAVWYQPLQMATNIYWCGYNSTTNSAISNFASGWEFESNDPISATCQKPVPEPATIMLLGVGLLGLGSWGRKKTKKDKES